MIIYHSLVGIFFSFVTIFIITSSSPMETDSIKQELCPQTSECNVCVSFSNNNCSMVWLNNSTTMCTNVTMGNDTMSMVSTKNGCKSMTTCTIVASCESCVNTTVDKDSKETELTTCKWSPKLNKCALNFTNAPDATGDAAQCKDPTTTTPATTTTASTTPATTTTTPKPVELCPNTEDCEKCVSASVNNINCSMVWLINNTMLCTIDTTNSDILSMVTTVNGCKSMNTCIKLNSCVTCLNTAVAEDSKNVTNTTCQWNTKLKKCASNFTHIADFDDIITDLAHCNELTTTPATTTTTTPTTTVAPSSDRRFDGPSFIGGIVLALGCMAISFVAWKFYKARTERNYHTL